MNLTPSYCLKTRFSLPKTLIFLVLIFFFLSGNANASDWQVGGTVDLSYANAFQSDDELPFRSKVSSSRLNEFSPNIGMFYVRKTASEQSRWGLELGGQAGYDTDGQVPGSDRLPGYSILRYVSRANVSYLAPIGNGLLFTAGLMNSFLGFDSFYAKDNFNTTRSWGSEYSPYFLIGAGAQYAFNDKVSASFYLVSDYDYLAFRGDQPKYAGQVAWTINPEWKFTENWFAGAEQRDSDIANWRYFSNSILQWSVEDLTLGLVYDVGTERLTAEQNKQALWMNTALSGRWHIDGPWSVALRPELYWDGDGTGNRQLIKSITTTVEYKIPFDSAWVAIRGEYRYDDSTGSQGGFFKSANSGQLISTQHSVFFSCLLNFDRAF